MNLILNLKELWLRRRLVALSVAAAAAIATVAIYQVSLLPPSIGQRADVEAEGSIDILVDSASSPIANAKPDLTGLTARAGVFAQLMAGGRVVGQIARRADIRAREVDVAGPVPIAGEAPGFERPTTHTHPYGIQITQQPELPILTVVTRAPTPAEARALAEAAPVVISREVESIQKDQATPAWKRVEFRALGRAEATPVHKALGKAVALGVFVVLLAIFVTLILAGPRFLAAWRGADPESPSTRQPPPVLLHADVGDDEIADSEANPVGRRGNP
ncbi:MAG TPA: hypothetical protein VGC49_13545 [Solirubrobacterales bacterium]